MAEGNNDCWTDWLGESGGWEELKQNVLLKVVSNTKYHIVRIPMSHACIRLASALEGTVCKRSEKEWHAGL